MINDSLKVTLLTLAYLLWLYPQIEESNSSIYALPYPSCGSTPRGIMIFHFLQNNSAGIAECRGCKNALILMLQCQGCLCFNVKGCASSAQFYYIKLYTGSSIEHRFLLVKLFRACAYKVYQAAPFSSRPGIEANGSLASNPGRKFASCCREDQPRGCFTNKDKGCCYVPQDVRALINDGQYMW